MELNASCKHILTALSEDQYFDEQTFKQLVNVSILSILKTSTKPLSEQIQEMISNNTTPLVPTTFDQKAVQSAIVYLLLEASKHDMAAIELTHLLEDHFVNRQRLNYLSQEYETYKKDIRECVLKQKTFSFPEIVQLDWRLDYVLKTSELKQVHEPVYTLRFKCKDGQEATISCNAEQLQDLHSKIRDATKQVERTFEQM
ncbi:hypothetical protein NAEGRDRAFT_74247 [Naegleria gruberi]|uniref:COMM domain-containing protein 3 n=1 Tax=Naegleria gruberi TaxID=5762 RepID=D2VYU7_NAEGR|nr:uncharacterized protein NAEGRDRAFT_74247 [Naegleria gruberi]EFC38019.1 hypothetical protein NAEGRDRAFT_74247 [Naegleria gruberi]|eukprot:XP_002670763.1 hypothetical protein NAEGRDRAFT_74247 [Naegleria gruberi strain NEG-M]